MINNEPVGFFKQPLKEGDHVVMMLRSGQSHYLRDCHIHSITYNITQKRLWDSVNQKYMKTKTGQDYYVDHKYPVVKISYDKEFKSFKYDEIEKKGSFVSLGIKKRISRVYNWESSITI
jgi:hypothetical protein